MIKPAQKITPFLWFDNEAEEALTEILKDQDPKQSQRVMKALMQMKKLDVPTLKRAYEQGD